MLGYKPREEILDVFFEGDEIRKVKQRLLTGHLIIPKHAMSEFDKSELDIRKSRIYPFEVHVESCSEATLSINPHVLIIPEDLFGEFCIRNMKLHTLDYHLEDDKEYSYKLNLLSNISGSYPQPYDVLYEEIKKQSA
ncbi:hypothetical protein HYV49_04610 [Candidatus Pacearchaeota archaeon]|nr:hypothetical protein [Candidatus Pacearchaeota archaeon]